jgi:hypothetical protein
MEKFIGGDSKCIYIYNSDHVGLSAMFIIDSRTVSIFWAHALSTIPLHFRAGSHGVPSPIHVSKSQHGGKVPTCEPQVFSGIWHNIIIVGSWLFYAKTLAWLGLSVGSSFLLDPTCNTSSKPHVQEMLPCRHLCHSWELGFVTSC